MKNPAEYKSTMMTARQAADVLKCVKRILTKARIEIEKWSRATAPCDRSEQWIHPSLLAVARCL